ncbi:hypothetical protein ACIBO4_01955 [Streptomyces sp. NPDC050149]|uniref:hypothetical protein n=1 Tax=Streptomyces sp. NPDC050149 TaxID=3365603 RepID=UPI0037AE71D8
MAALIGLLLASLVSLGTATPVLADDKRPPGSADGIDLSKEDGKNPLLKPVLRPIAELRFLLDQLRSASSLGELLTTQDKDLKNVAFDPGRNGAVVYIDPSLLTDDQVDELMAESNLDTEGKDAWRTTPAKVESVRKYLDPEVVQRLSAKKTSHVIAFSALNVKNGNHSEAVIQERLNKLGISQDAVILGGSERQQCERCARLYPMTVPTVYAYSYNLSARELAGVEAAVEGARQRAASKGPEAQKTAEDQKREEIDLKRRARNDAAAVQLGVDLRQVPAVLGKEPGSWQLYPFSHSAKCLPPTVSPQRFQQKFALTTGAEAADPCDGAEEPTGNSGSARAATGLGRTLATPGMGAGGIDFSTMQLRYLGDPDDGSGLQYSFSAEVNPLKGDARTATGRTAATQSSDAFFVWLSLRPQDFWVNLNPTEPNRVIDDQLGRTDAGRVLLEADLRMKKTVGKLIHPHSAPGRKFWDGVQGNCLSFRNWILPAPASVHQEDGKLYILDAPLDVKMETQYLASLGQSSARSCPRQDKTTEDHNEALFRSQILPKLKHAINNAPEYAALRRVYLARVAAQWYRELSQAKKTTYGKLIDSDDIGAWATKGDWKPKETFDRYVDSYTKGEFKVTDKSTRGNTTYVKTYVYGGVDLTNVPFDRVSDESFATDFADLPRNVERSLKAPSTTDGGDTVWLGSPTPRQAAGPGTDGGVPPTKPASVGTWALRLLPVCLLPAAVLLWWRRRRPTASARTGPLRRAEVGRPDRQRNDSNRTPW